MSLFDWSGLGTEIINAIIMGVTAFLSGIWAMLSALLTAVHLGFIPVLLDYLYSFVTFIITILVNPFLLLMIVFAASHYYTALMSHSRKEIVINYFKFIGIAFKAGWNGLMMIYQLVIWVLNTITNMIP